MPDLDEQTTQTKPAASPRKDDKKTQPRDPAREVIEAIVFVVVLVLLLKLFVTEAFVIPTGSMAETLYGYQKIIPCPKCSHEFPVNSHDEVEGNQFGVRMPLYGYCCPNCRYLGNVRELKPEPINRSGDRVLVLKPLYHIKEPKRGDVVVFKYPDKPQDKHTAQNYIKRAEGFGGETVAIFRGDLYVTTALSYPENDPRYPYPNNKLDLWKPEYMYRNNSDAQRLFNVSRKAGFLAGGGFGIVRKGEAQLLADRRIVWDNDKQPKELAGVVPPRWYATSEAKDAWKADDAQQPRAFAHQAGELHWIHYRHLPMQWKSSDSDSIDTTPRTDFKTLSTQEVKPIDNFLGYNAGREYDPNNGRVGAPKESEADSDWVGDLILECEADVTAGGEVTLELSRGVNRFQAAFGNGNVTLARIGPGADAFGKPSRPCKVNSGHYSLRFANVDSRLWVWVDGRRIDFGTEGDYQTVEPGPGDSASPKGWVKANDVDAPAGIGARGQVTVKHIVLNRDIYYTRSGSDWLEITQPVLDKLAQVSVPSSVIANLTTLKDRLFVSRSDFSEEVHKLLSTTEHERWISTIETEADFSGADIFYVQPGHYMCLGDNSAQSLDSRKWGTVPDRLMLGKAVFVFWPRDRIGLIK